jgi:phosphoribosylformylglycinamidine synthase
VKARVHITLKNGVLDPQGKAVQHALSGLGFAGINDVRQGKFIELDLVETDADRARASVEQMCKTLLANSVIENFQVELLA